MRRALSDAGADWIGPHTRADDARVDEPIEHVIEVLKQRGVAVDGPVPDNEGRLKLAYFSDPDGNPLYLAETASP